MLSFYTNICFLKNFYRIYAVKTRHRIYYFHGLFLDKTVISGKSLFPDVIFSLSAFAGLF